MSRILIAWELGSGYGHLDGFATIARALRERGHEVVFALRDLSRAEKRLGCHGYRLLQAPVWLPPADGFPPAANFAELLFRFGYLDTAALTAMLKAWREIFTALAPERLLLNFAPTALLAARGLGIASTMFGTGYECPPAIDDMPTLAPWAKPSLARMRQAQAHITRVINSALIRLDTAPLASFAALFRDSATILCTTPELDPFAAARVNAAYVGPVLESENAAGASWPPGDPRVFCYLKPQDPRTVPALKTLTELGASVVAHVPDLGQRELAELRAMGVGFSPDPIDLQAVARECRCIVCHAGHGSVATALTSGCPVLLLPMQGEQLLTSQRVAAFGAGLYVDLFDRSPPLRKLLLRLFSEPSFADKARQFAARYTREDRATRLAAFVDAVESTTAAPRAGDAGG
ncbi:MAG: hypothetical protein IT531_03420 [Burkholderiales bacterium]|nr:hypothetical protein [Burkholderiales bacterium]